MAVWESVIEKLSALPSDKQQQVLDFIESLGETVGGKRPRLSVEGLWAHLCVDISDEDIAEARREMWGTFPRDDI